MDEWMESVARHLEAMEDEKQEACIHCGKVWYVIHHDDGRCHECKRAGKPGRTQIERRQEIRSTIVSLMILGFAIYLAYQSLN